MKPSISRSVSSPEVAGLIAQKLRHVDRVGNDLDGRPSAQRVRQRQRRAARVDIDHHSRGQEAKRLAPDLELLGPVQRLAAVELRLRLTDHRSGTAVDTLQESVGMHLEQVPPDGLARDAEMLRDVGCPGSFARAQEFHDPCAALKCPQFCNSCSGVL
jgi:hypothetical protein